MIEKKVFCKIENKKCIPKCFSTFRNYLSNSGTKKWATNLEEREKLIFFIYDEWAPEIIEFQHIMKKRSYNNEIRVLKQFLKDPNNKELERKIDTILERDGDLEDGPSMGFTEKKIKKYIENQKNYENFC